VFRALLDQLESDRSVFPAERSELSFEFPSFMQWRKYLHYEFAFVNNVRDDRDAHGNVYNRLWNNGDDYKFIDTVFSSTGRCSVPFSM
jgi:hypothetical protein